MGIYVEIESRVQFDFANPEQLIKKTIKTVMEDKKIPKDLDVNVILTTPSQIKNTNMEMRNVDSVTDVLSFPYYDYDVPGIFTEEIDPEEENILGDIMICSSKIKEQAQKYGHSQRREMAFLVVHSMLHLVGYDHMSDRDAEEMQAEERRLMDILKIKR